MTKDDDNLNDDNPGDEQRDSRLETFLRRASAIIAAEKGLNNAAKAKLDDLARRLHLPDELFEKGLKKLQDSNSPIGNLTDYEEGFLKFLKHEFSQKREGAVLSISVEERAIAHARKRFGIAAHRAEQLIGHQATLSGIGRLSRSDAREFGRQMIYDLVGKRLSLDDDTEDKIYQVGRKWGFDPDEVDRLIAIKFDENAAEIRQRQRRPLVLGVISTIGLVVAGFGGKWINDNYDALFLDPVVKKAPEPEPVIPVPNLVEAKSELELAFPDLADALTSTDQKRRGDAIATATDRMLNSSRDTETEYLAIRGWYLKEPDEKVIGRFVQKIDEALGAEPKSNRNRALEVPYRAAKLVRDIHDSATSPESLSRREQLIRRLKRHAGNENQFDSAIARRQWSQLIENSWSSPARNSILIEPLTTLTQSKLEAKELREFASRSVRTILLADRQQWRNMRQPLLASINSADEVQRIEWIDIWLDDFDGTTGFRDFVGPQLVARSGKEPLPAARDYDSFLRSQRSDWKNRRLRPALIRHEKINKRIAQIVPEISASTDFRANPDLIFQAASAANLCLEAIAITDAGKGGDESAWSEVDAQLDKLDLRLREFVFLDEPTDDKPTLSSAGFDTTMRDRTMASFRDRSRPNRARRLAAIERLPSLAAKFDTLPQPMATSMASYLLSPIEPDEWIQMQRVVPDLTQWPRLILALADQVGDSTAPQDQLMTMFTVLNGEPLKASDGWKENMRLELLRLGHEALLADDVVDSNSSDSDWVRLEKYLQTAFHRRGVLLGNTRIGSNRSAVENAEHCVRAVADNLVVTERAIGLIKKSSGNELEQIVLLNQLLAKVANSPGPKSIGSRLLESELKLLQIWNRQREQQLRGLLDES